MMFKQNNPFHHLHLLIFLLLSIIFSSCNAGVEGTEPVLQTQEPVDASSMPTPAPSATITPTPMPLALRVNGVGISLEEYEVVKGMLEMAVEQDENPLSAEEIVQRVQGQLIDLELLAQAARAQGYLVDEAQLDEKMTELVNLAGGSDAFSTWITTYGMSEDIFRRVYQRELEAAWQRDQVIAAVGETAEQIHARQILVRSQETADQIYRQLQGGSDFATLAETYDPVTKGELGWFPRGYLFLAEIEEALFAMQPGAYTGVIQTDYGFHIFQVVEREEHILSNNARQTLMHKTLDEWIAVQRADSQIEVLLP